MVALTQTINAPYGSGVVVPGTGVLFNNAMVLFEPDRLDYHVYTHWLPIVDRRTWTPQAGPWRWAQRDITYAADACPATLGLLGRAVHLDVSPLLTNEDVEETVEGINKVLSGLL